MKQTKKGIVSNKEAKDGKSPSSKSNKVYVTDPSVDSSEEGNDEDTSWLITRQFVDSVSEHRYYAYQIVYTYINRSILSTEQKLVSSKTCIVHLSNIARDLVKAMKFNEIKMLSIFKFTAAINTGIWAYNFNQPVERKMQPTSFTRVPREETKRRKSFYDKPIIDPKTYFTFHEPNMQQFLDPDYLLKALPIKYFREDGKLASGGPTPNIDPSIDVHSVPYVNSKLKDLMLTFPTLLIILNRKEEALYILEQC